MNSNEKCITCGLSVEFPGRDLCFACYCDTEGREHTDSEGI